MNKARNYSTLEECQEEIRRLKEENYHLRQASQAFGELAERLRCSLEEERHLTRERRWTVTESETDGWRKRPID
jgi:hypothetical protein